MMIRARAGLVRARTGLVNAARGLAKSYGERLRGCKVRNMNPEKAEGLSPELQRRKITTSFLNPLRRGYRSLLPLMPMALESFDLRGYDLVLSSESGPAKGLNPIDKWVRVGGRPVRVIGVYQEASNIFEPPGQEQFAIVPYRLLDHAFTIDKTNALSGAN